MEISTVADLIQELSKLDPNAHVVVAVGWSQDTAHSNEGGTLVLDVAQCDTMKIPKVTVRGYMENCVSNLEFED
jgi:hypothetical protein